jgi:hypothetical protein
MWRLSLPGCGRRWMVVPAKADGNLLIGTWNVRAFDRAAAAWRTSKGGFADSGLIRCGVHR